MKKLILIILVFFTYSLEVNSQTSTESTYSYIEAFKTAFYSNTSTETRSASGKPGHKYWQNRADYIIDVELDTLSDIIMGLSLIHI